MESETFFLPGFILEDDDNATALFNAQEPSNVEQQLPSQPADLFFVPPLSPNTNPWNKTSTSEAETGGTLTPILAAVSSNLLPDSIEALLLAPAPSQRTDPTELSRHVSLQVSQSARAKANSATLVDDYGLDLSTSTTALLFKAPPGFENVAAASFSAPTSPQRHSLSSETTANSSAMIANDWSLLVPSLLQGDLTEGSTSNETFTSTQKNAQNATTTTTTSLSSPTQAVQSNTDSSNVTDHASKRTVAEMTDKPKKSWVSVVAVEQRANETRFTTTASRTLTGTKSTSTTSTPARPRQDFVPAKTNPPTSAESLAEAVTVEEVVNANTRQSGVSNDSIGASNTATSPSRTPLRRNRNRNNDANNHSSSRENSWSSSAHSTTSANSTEPLQSIVPVDELQSNDESEAKTITTKTAKKTKLLRHKRDDIVMDSAHSHDNTSGAAADESSDATPKPTEATIQASHRPKKRANPLTCFLNGCLGCFVGLWSLVAHALQFISDIVAPLFNFFGTLFAFIAKSLIISALVLANTFKYAAAEVEQSESGSFFCYLVFYVVPNGCDVLMSLFSVPHFTPHVISSTALYLLCLTGHGANGNGNTTSNSKRKTYRPRTLPLDPQAETVSRFALQTLRYSILFNLVVEGFVQPNSRVMMLDVPSRLFLAYILSLLRTNLILSPTAWVCGSVQIILSAHLPYNKLTECLLLLVGLASIRLCSVVVQAMDQEAPAKEV